MNHCPLKLQMCKNKSGSETFHESIETHDIEQFHRQQMNRMERTYQFRTLIHRKKFSRCFKN